MSKPLMSKPLYFFLKAPILFIYKINCGSDHLLLLRRHCNGYAKLRDNQYDVHPILSWLSCLTKRNHFIGVSNFSGVFNLSLSLSFSAWRANGLIHEHRAVQAERLVSQKHSLFAFTSFLLRRPHVPSRRKCKVLQKERVQKGTTFQWP